MCINGAAMQLPEIPDWLCEELSRRAPIERASELGEILQEPTPDYIRSRRSRGLGVRSRRNLGAPEWSPAEEARLWSALSFVPAVKREDWLHVGMAMHSTNWPNAFEIWDAWSRTRPEKYNEADQQKTWESFGRPRVGQSITVATIYRKATDNGWTEESLASANKDFRNDTDTAGPNATPGDGKGNGAPSWRDSMISAADLRRMTFEPVRYVLDRFIPEGMTLLVGRPKVGKSWWVLDLCLACAAGHSAFGTLKALQGDVLYLALEDGKRRLQRQLDKLLPTFSGEWPNELKLVPMGGWRRADQGGLEDIEAWCKSVSNPVLVVVDTLERIRKPANGKSPLYSADYEAITGLQKIAIKYGIAIVVLHHDRKSDADDAFDTVSGTLGLTGAADTILIIKRRPNGVVLYARGRDIEESETAMQFDKATCRWNILGAASEVLRSNERARVIAALKSAGQPLSVREIMADAEMQNRNATDILLGKMARDGEIVRVGRGRYDLSTQEQRTDRTERKNA